MPGSYTLPDVAASTLRVDIDESFMQSNENMGGINDAVRRLAQFFSRNYVNSFLWKKTRLASDRV
jgi:hypothetical protein